MHLDFVVQLENYGFAYIKCECGTEVLVILDAAALCRAIEDHGELHWKSQHSPSDAQKECDRILNLLIERVI
jgi:hypothetical protein